MSPILTNPLHQKLLLAAASIGMFLDGLDCSIVTIILPDISVSFGTDAGTVSWVIISYLLMIAGLILVFGKYAEGGHIRLLFIGGLAVFTVGSAFCGISPDYGVLLASRILQGIGAAMIAATATLLCVTYLPREMLGLALGAISMAVSVGVAAGPAIGGFLVQYLSWHWAFLINLPVGLFLILFSWSVIPPDLPREKTQFDLPGAVLLFLGMGAGVYLLERIAHLGLSDLQIQFSFLLCFVCLVVFIIRSLHNSDPLCNIRIFQVWKFTAAFLVFLIFACVYAGMIYLLPFFLDAGMGLEPAISGLFLVCPPIITAVLGLPIGRWSDLAGRRPFVIAAALTLIALHVIYVFITPASGITPLLVSLLLLGLFWGFAGGPAASRVVDTAPPDEKGTGTSLLVTAMYLGSVIGTALYAMIFTLATAQGGVVAFSDLDPAIFMHGFHVSMAAGLILSVASLVLSAVPREDR